MEKLKTRNEIIVETPPLEFAGLEFEDIPDSAQIYFLQRRKRECGYRKSPVPDTWVDLSSATSDGLRYFTATYDPTHETRLTEIAQMIDTKDIIVGTGQIIKGPEEHRSIKEENPFVGWTETIGENVRKGMGAQRLIAMNSYAEHAYGLPLVSSPRIFEGGRAVWQKLATIGVAKEIDALDADGKKRYIFKTNAHHL